MITSAKSTITSLPENTINQTTNSANTDSSPQSNADTHSTSIEIEVSKPVDAEVAEHKTDDTNLVFSERKLVVRMFLLAVCHVFMNASRQPIWILYASQFNNTSLQLISYILLIGLVWRGISGLIYVSLANKYGYDKAVIALIFMLVIAIFIECTATSFYVFSFGFFLSQVSLVPVVLSCIAWLLPHKIAVDYTSYLFASIIVAFLLGPAITGIVSFFVSYKFVFWINFVFGLVTLIYALIFIPCNIQKKIEQIQLKQMKLTKHNEKQKNITVDKKTQEKQWETIEIDGTAPAQETEDKSRKTTMVDDDEMYPIGLMMRDKEMERENGIKLGKYEWFMLIASMCANIWIPFGETVMGIYYCLYVIDNLKHSNIMVASLQLLLVAVGAIMGKLSTTKVIEKIIIFRNKYILMVFCAFFNGVMMFVVYPNTKNINLWYLYGFIGGILLGISGMTTQIVILEFQPSSHSGYVNGIGEFLRSVAKAFGLLIVGLYWTHNENVLFYVLGVTKCIQVILSVAMGLAHHLNKK